MSTSCIITARRNPTLGIYIHWDGDDREMVEDIVEIARKHNARNVNFDEPYGIARLACACEEYFKNETTGFGVVIPDHCDYMYHWVIDEDWNVKLDRD